MIIGRCVLVYVLLVCVMMALTVSVSTQFMHKWPEPLLLALCRTHPARGFLTPTFPSKTRRRGSRGHHY